MVAPPSTAAKGVTAPVHSSVERVRFQFPALARGTDGHGQFDHGTSSKSEIWDQRGPLCINCPTFASFFRRSHSTEPVPKMLRVDLLSHFFGVPEKCLADELTRQGVKIKQDGQGRAAIPADPQVIAELHEKVLKGLT